MRRQKICRSHISGTYSAVELGTSLGTVLLSLLLGLGAAARELAFDPCGELVCVGCRRNEHQYEASLICMFGPSVCSEDFQVLLLLLLRLQLLADYVLEQLTCSLQWYRR